MVACAQLEISSKLAMVIQRRNLILSRILIVAPCAGYVPVQTGNSSGMG